MVFLSLDGIILSDQTLISGGVTLASLIIVPVLFFLLGKIKWKHPNFFSTFFRLEKWPVALSLSLILLYLLFPFNEFLNGALSQKIVFIVILLVITIFFLRFIYVIKALIFLRFPIDQPDNLQERKARTQFLYIHYLFVILVVILGTAVIFWQFDVLRGLGAGLLASAGVAGIVIAFAAQRMLGNFLAGFQIAFAQPFRIDDVVIIENEWGKIEEITLTYVVVRIWDQRRLVIPISYFIDNPFQNWTRTTAEIWGTVFLYVDYTTPVEKVRKELQRIVSASDLWDGKVVVLQVTDASEKTMTLRALVSARNSSDSWSLRCLVREKLILFLQNEYPDSLPRIRLGEQLPLREHSAKD